MQKKISRIVASLLAASTLFSSSILAVPTSFIPNSPELSEKSYVLADFASGNLLVEHNADERLEPASLTKMMTMYVVDRELSEGRIKLTDNVRISKKAWQTQGSRMFLEPDTEVPVQDLIRGIIIQSGNDASVALAEHVAGTEDAFVDLMNKNAQHLGMNATHFMNVTGLPDPQHYTTARDLATLAAAIIRDFPESYKLYSEKWFVYRNIRQPNRNRLLWNDQLVDGIKTGHTDSAGFCLVASAKKDDMRLISVLLGAKSDGERAKDSESLLTYGFRFFNTYKLYNSGQSVAGFKVWMGDKSNAQAGLVKDLYVTVPHGQYRNLQITMDAPQALKAPINKGDKIGTIKVMLNGKEQIVAPLVALEDVKEGGIWSRFVDYIVLTYKNWISSIFGTKENEV